MDLERQGVAELALHAQPGLGGDPVHVGAREALDVADPLRLGDLRRAPGAQVVLQRHLDDHRAADARGLAQQRDRIGHVLEHVAEHAQVERAVGLGQPLAVEATATRSSGRCARDPRGLGADLVAHVLAPVSAAGRARRAARRRRSRPRRRPPATAGCSATTWSALPRALSARQRAHLSASSPLCE